MTRYKIAREVMEEVPHQILVSGAIWWEEDVKIPLIVEQSKFIGYVTDIRREGEDLTAELVINRGIISEEEEELLLKYMAPTVLLNEVEKHVFKEVLYVTRGRLREVFLTRNVPWANGWEGR